MGIFDWTPFTKKGRKNYGQLFMGSPEEHERKSTLLPGQQGLYDQLQAAGMGPGAGGAFGDAADYYRSLLNDDNATFNAMAAPETRRFNEDIIPGLSEQFAGMGFGGSGLGGSGFRNAAVNAGTDLAERLGAIRANLRQQGAAGLAGIGQQGLGNYSQDVVTKQGSQGLFGALPQIAGQAAGAYFGGGFGGFGGGNNGNQFGRSNWQGNNNGMNQG